MPQQTGKKHQPVAPREDGTAADVPAARLLPEGNSRPIAGETARKGRRLSFALKQCLSNLKHGLSLRCRTAPPAGAAAATGLVGMALAVGAASPLASLPFLDLPLPLHCVSLTFHWPFH